MSFVEELKKRIEAKKDSVTVVNRGVTPLSLLGIAFIVLKVMGQITWSWWWVLAPFWIPVIVSIALLLFTFSLIAVIVANDQKTVKEVKAAKKTVKTKKTKKKDEAKVEGEDGQSNPGTN